MSGAGGVRGVSRPQEWICSRVWLHSPAHSIARAVFCHKMVSPGREFPGWGCRLLPNSEKPPLAKLEIGKRTCKPNSVVCGHSSRRRVAADTHQRPTRRFRQLLEPPCRIGPMRSATWLFSGASLPIWSCSVWGLPCPRLYSRSGALLPHHFTLTPAPGPQAEINQPVAPGRPSKGGVAEAVSFLWHWPSTDLEARVPDVIRHTALRSSDFPPPAARFRETPAATARSSCQSLVYRELQSVHRCLHRPESQSFESVSILQSSTPYGEMPSSLKETGPTPLAPVTRLHFTPRRTS